MIGVILDLSMVPQRIVSGRRTSRFGDDDARKVLDLMKEYGISARLTFSNSLLREEHLLDKKCNALCRLFEETGDIQNGVIIHSDLLLEYLKKNYPNLYFVSSITKVLTNFQDFLKEVKEKIFGMLSQIFV